MLDAFEPHSGNYFDISKKNLANSGDPCLDTVNRIDGLVGRILVGPTDGRHCCEDCHGDPYCMFMVDVTVFVVESKLSNVLNNLFIRKINGKMSIHLLYAMIQSVSRGTRSILCSLNIPLAHSIVR